ncbi:MAG: hypothetical protein WHS64_07795 [Fervidobacterium sp.]|nr:hypothetical protein [Fervidobacterium gondwanense]
MLYVRNFLINIVENENMSIIDNKMNKKAKRSCPLTGGQLAFGME